MQEQLHSLVLSCLKNNLETCLLSLVNNNNYPLNEVDNLIFGIKIPD